MNNILDILQYLKPDIKVSVYNEIPTQNVHRFDSVKKINTLQKEIMPGFEYDVEINGQYIKYNDSEDFRPTKEDILAVKEKDMIDWRESRRKEKRDKESRKNLSLIASFAAYKKDDRSATFSDFLDKLEKFSEELP